MEGLSICRRKKNFGVGLNMNWAEIKTRPFTKKPIVLIKHLLEKLESIPTNLLCLILFTILFVYLAVEVTNIKKSIRMLDFDVDISSIERDVSDIQSDLSSLEGDISSINSQLDSVDSQLGSLDSTLSEIEIDMRFR